MAAKGRKAEGKPLGKPLGKPSGKAGAAGSAPAGAKFKIIHDVPTCIGCGACAAVSSNWVMKGEKAKVKVMLLGKLGDNIDAAESCPVTCIHIVDLQKNKKLI